jgi:hypothetical protein
MYLLLFLKLKSFWLNSGVKIKLMSACRLDNLVGLVALSSWPGGGPITLRAQKMSSVTSEC